MTFLVLVFATAYNWVKGISQGTVFSILHEKLDVRKISAGWVPRLLSVKDKRNRVLDAFPSQS